MSKMATVVVPGDVQHAKPSAGCARLARTSMLLHLSPCAPVKALPPNGHVCYHGGLLCDPNHEHRQRERLIVCMQIPARGQASGLVGLWTWHG